ncbi:MAG: hypothetical protein CMP47_01960 [Rickettsiales bacterium]|nr:hypothetical protein [Rickettsiales bacterium]
MDVKLQANDLRTFVDQLRRFQNRNVLPNTVLNPVGNLAELERMYQVFRMRTELDEGILYVLIVVMGKSTV